MIRSSFFRVPEGRFFSFSMAGRPSLLPVAAFSDAIEITKITHITSITTITASS